MTRAGAIPAADRRSIGKTNLGATATMAKQPAARVNAFCDAAEYKFGIRPITTGIPACKTSGGYRTRTQQHLINPTVSPDASEHCNGEDGHPAGWDVWNWEVFPRKEFLKLARLFGITWHVKGENWHLTVSPWHYNPHVFDCNGRAYLIRPGKHGLNTRNSTRRALWILRYTYGGYRTPTQIRQMQLAANG